jgi:sulfide:quinone oxidoreductase
MAVEPAARSVASMARNGLGSPPERAARRVLIAGGGVAGLEAMLALRKLAYDRLEVELLAPQRDFVYRPLSVAEPFGLGGARRFDLEALSRGVGAGYRADAVEGVDAGRRTIRTRGGEELAFDALLIACGARMREAIPGAITFWGTGDTGRLRTLLQELRSGIADEVVFSMPAQAGWPLPLYELALMTAAHLAGREGDDPRLTIATPEASPLELFGARASAAVRALLASRGIGLCCSCYPVEVDATGLRIVPGGHLSADRVLAIPGLEGPGLEGVPHDDDDFIPTDSFGRVEGLEEAAVFAAGDATSFPVKQGGLAAQQADAAAELIAAEAGAGIDPTPFRPVLRGMLLTGSQPSYLRAEISGGRGEDSIATPEPLWWPPGKVAGRYLAPHLASLGRLELEPPPPGGDGQLPVEVELLP